MRGEGPSGRRKGRDAGDEMGSRGCVVLRGWCLLLRLRTRRKYAASALLRALPASDSGIEGKRRVGGYRVDEAGASVGAAGAPPSGYPPVAHDPVRHRVCHLKVVPLLRSLIAHHDVLCGTASVKEESKVHSEARYEACGEVSEASGVGAESSL